MTGSNALRTELQGLFGSGFELGSNAPDDNDVLTLTINHFSTWEYGSNFFFFDVTQETNGAEELDIYGEIYPSLSLSRIIGQDLSFGPVADIGPVAGLNVGTDLGIALFGVKVDLDLPAAATASVQATSYDTFRDPLDRDLDTTYQFTLTWNVPIVLDTAEKWWFSFSGFVDYIGPRGDNLRWRIVSQPQIRWDIGRLFGVPDRIHVGTELGIDRNKFGNPGVNEFVPKALLVLKL
jgi:hypothetical protein